MGFLADSLLHGAGLSSPFGIPTGPTAIVAPGYPLLVATLFYLFGSFSWPAALSLMLLHALCNTITVYLVYRLARSLADERTAAVIAMFWACSLPLLWMPTIFWETSFSCLITVAAVTLMLNTQQERSIPFWMLCGAVCGTSGLFNPALLPSMLLLVTYTVVKTTRPAGRGRRLAAATAGLALTFSPWPVRNAFALHALVLTRTTVGLELWMGNHPGSSGFLETSLFPTYNSAELADFRERGEIGYTAHKGQLAKAYIEANPQAFILLSGRRMVRFWTGNGTRSGSALFQVHALISSCLGFCGLFLLWQRGNKRAAISAGIFLLLFPLPYYVTHAEFRYRLVLDPLLTALGAPALQWLLARRQTSPEQARSDNQLIAPCSG